MEQKQIEEQIKNLSTHIEGLVEKERTASETEAKAIRSELKGLEEKFGDMLKLQAELDGVKKTNEDIRKEIQDSAAEMQKLKDFKSDGESKTANKLIEEKVKAITEAGSWKTKWNTILESKAVADMALANFSGNASVGYLDSGVMTLPRKVHVRSLLSASPFNKEVFQYEVEGGNEGAPTTVADGTAMAQIDNDFTSTTVNAYYVGAYYRISEASLNEVSWLSRDIQGRGIERVLNFEDSELLTGTTEIVGLSVNALSDQVTSGFTTPAAVVPNKIDALLFTVAKLKSNDVVPNAILMNPQDKVGITYQARATDGQYLSTGAVMWQGQQMYVDGLPVFESTAVSAGNFFVGDWTQMSAEILQNEGLNVRFFEQDGTNATTNDITIRLRERILFPIYRPASFIYGNFANIQGSLST